jgi:hypothetical protein
VTPAKEFDVLVTLDEEGLSRISLCQISRHTDSMSIECVSDTN